MTLWQDLTSNLAIVALFISGWRYVGGWLDEKSLLVRRLAFGAALGVAAVIAMTLTVRVADGVVFDLRLSFVAVSGLFGGPIAASISILLTGLARALIGGISLWKGLAFLVAAGAMGVGGYYLAKWLHRPMLSIVAVSAASAALVLQGLGSVSFSETAASNLYFLVSAVSAVFLTTLALSMVVLHRLKSSDERTIMRVALQQAPDYQYVTDRQGRYLIANRNVAEFWGYRNVADIRGKIPEAMLDPERALELHEHEQHLMQSGGAVEAREERIVDRDGKERWFATSKSTIISPDGRVIGLAGVARDITEQKRKDADLEYHRSMLSYVLSQMNDGLALFDEDNIMVFCNEQFRRSFPIAGLKIGPGMRAVDMIRLIGEAGEDTSLPEDLSDEAITEIIDSMDGGAARELHSRDGHWLKIKSLKTAGGKVILTVMDITESKLAQQALLGMTDQLKALASTDGLTGLMNRRELDRTLHDELKRAQRAEMPLSLLLIDVDHFKSFNDLYGHLAGDDCLRTISACLKTTAKRPGDVAARFGGEEFVLILPDTDEDAATKIAEKLRAGISKLALTHEGSDRGIVTASTGVGCFCPDDERLSSAELLQRADEALYQAKDDGRNRVVAWRRSCELKRA